MYQRFPPEASFLACPSPFRKQRTQSITTYPVTAPEEKGDNMSEIKEEPLSFEISQRPKIGTATKGGTLC